MELQNNLELVAECRAVTIDRKKNDGTSRFLVFCEVCTCQKKEQHIKVHDQMNSVTTYSNFKDILKSLQNAHPYCNREIIEQSFSRNGAEAFFRACSQQTSRMFMFSVLGARYANPLFLHLTQREEKRKPFGAMWEGGDCRKFYIWPFSVNISVKRPVGHACDL